MSETVLPRRPLLAPWRDYAVTPDRFLLRYADGVVVFEGRASTALLPELASRLDGSRDLERIFEELGEPARPAIQQALEMLMQHGLLLEGADVRGQDAGLRHTARALAEVSIGALSLNDIEQLVSTATFTVMGDGPLAQLVTSTLRSCGLGAVEAVAEAEAAAHLRDLGPDGISHVVVAPRLQHARVLTEVNTWALRTERRWTQVLPYDGQHAIIGPTFVPRETGCQYCFRLRRRSALDYFDEAVDFDAAVDAERVARTGEWHSPAQDAAVAGHAAHLLLWAVMPEGTVVDPLLGRAFTLSWGMTGPSMKEHYLHRVPRCRDCSRARDTGVPQPWVSATPMRRPVNATSGDHERPGHAVHGDNGVTAS